MTEPKSPSEMFDFFQKMLNPMAQPMQQMFLQSLQPQEIEKKISELKYLESWLSMSAQSVQMTIKMLELQKNMLASFSAPADQPAAKKETKNP